MRDIDDLRHALDVETAHLAMDIRPELIQQRVRGIRVRRATGAAVVAALAVAALAVPGVLFTNLLRPGASVGAGGMPSLCPSTSLASLGPLIDTGTTLDAPNLHTQYDVLIGLVGTRDEPGFVTAFRDRQTQAVHTWDTILLVRDAQGDLSGKRQGDPSFQFMSKQLTLGPNNVLDVGLYTRAAQRITVTSESRETDAHTRGNAATGWTLFWAQRAAAALPADYHLTAAEYMGPERLTLRAYDAAGGPQHSVTGGVLVGHNVQNPRDGSATAAPSPSPDPSARPRPSQGPSPSPSTTPSGYPAPTC